MRTAPNFFKDQTQPPSSLSPVNNVNSKVEYEDISVEVNFSEAFQFEKVRAFIPHYSNYYFDEEYANKLLEQDSVDCTKLQKDSALLSQLIHSSHQKISSTVSKESIKYMNNFIYFSKKKLTHLEYSYFIAQKIKLPNPDLFEIMIRKEAVKVIIVLCESMEGLQRGPEQKDIWKKIFFILETFSSSHIFSNLNKMNENCLSTSMFTERLARSYKNSGLPFNLIYLQQIMADNL